MTSSEPTRRNLFGGGTVAMAAAVAGAAAMTATATPAAARQSRRSGAPSDADVLNFALNLEYLEAEFYLRAINGQGLEQSLTGAAGGPVNGGRRVNITDPTLNKFFGELARNEFAHVNFIKGAAGSAAVDRPRIDFEGGFAGVAQAAGLGAGFDPFADEESFLIGAFLFEDVGVTAYMGAAASIRNRDVLKAAASIHAAEAYHAGFIRGTIYRRGGRALDAANRISALRDQVDGGTVTDMPVSVNGKPNIAPTDDAGIALARTPQQVLNVVYATPGQGVSSGGFFPDGMNGRIQTT